MIQPTPGRIVWYYPSAFDMRGGNEPPMNVLGEYPLAAQVVGIRNDRCVNLLVTDAVGFQFRRPMVQLLQGDDQDVPVDDDRPHCAWMPYQKGQAGAAWKAADKGPLSLADDSTIARRLQDLIAVQSASGTVDQGDYQHGMANGLICALSVVTGEDPKYIEFKDPKQRVQIEKIELEAKLKKLEPFINSEKFETLPEGVQDLLMQQHGIMHQYVKVLAARLALM